MTDERFCTVIQMIRERLDRIDHRLSRLEDQHDEIMRFYSAHNAQDKLRQFFLKNWWKIGAVIIPVLFFLGDLSVHIRKLI